MIFNIFEQDGVTVANTIIANLEFMQTQYPEGNYAQVEQPEQVVPEPPVVRKISKLGYLNRFTDDEAIDLDLASIGATREAAFVRRLLNKVNAATFIDLDDPEIVDGVTKLAAAGLLAENRVNEILFSPIQDKERI